MTPRKPPPNPAAALANMRPRVPHVCPACGVTFIARAVAIYCGHACGERTRRHKAAAVKQAATATLTYQILQPRRADRPNDQHHGWTLIETRRWKTAVGDVFASRAEAEKAINELQIVMGWGTLAIAAVGALYADAIYPALARKEAK